MFDSGGSSSRYYNSFLFLFMTKYMRITLELICTVFLLYQFFSLSEFFLLLFFCLREICKHLAFDVNSKNVFIDVLDLSMYTGDSILMETTQVICRRFVFST